MTEVIEYKCKSCNKKYGPIGMHGAAVELTVICRKRKDIFVAPAKEGKPQKSNCVQCGSKYESFDCRCPACGSKELYYRGINLSSDFWMRCERKG